MAGRPLSFVIHFQIILRSPTMATTINFSDKTIAGRELYSNFSIISRERIRTKPWISQIGTRPGKCSKWPTLDLLVIVWARALVDVRDWFRWQSFLRLSLRWQSFLSSGWQFVSVVRVILRMCELSEITPFIRIYFDTMKAFTTQTTECVHPDVDFGGVTYTVGGRYEQLV